MTEEERGERRVSGTRGEATEGTCFRIGDAEHAQAPESQGDITESADYGKPFGGDGSEDLATAGTKSCAKSEAVPGSDGVPAPASDPGTASGSDAAQSDLTASCGQVLGMTFDSALSLFRLSDAAVIDCVFTTSDTQPDPVEFQLKYASRISVERCRFDAPSPLWHNRFLNMLECAFSHLATDPLWYGRDCALTHCEIRAEKAVRGCLNVSLSGCDITSPGFGWKCSNLLLEDSRLVTDCCMLDSANVTLRGSRVTGGSALQYARKIFIEDCEIDSDLALWHAQDVTIRNTRLKGDRLAWYSDDLTLVNCHIEGARPLCHCRNLRLIDCTLGDSCAMAFECSQAEAEIKGRIPSVKNLLSGHVICDDVGKIIRENCAMHCAGEVTVRGGK